MSRIVLWGFVSREIFPASSVSEELEEDAEESPRLDADDIENSE